MIESVHLPPRLMKLMSELMRFPGVGEKSALRMVLFILRRDRELFKKMGEAFLDVYGSVKVCRQCYNISEDELCEICKDQKREQNILCLVEDIGDLISIERSGQFKGRYFVLSGLISPVADKNLDENRVKELENTVLNNGITEIILALNPTVEGEATSLYIKDCLKNIDVKITRIAYGIPMGSDIEYLDEITMAVALQGRKELE